MLASMRWLLCGERMRCYVFGGKNDICNRAQITTQGIYLHYGFDYCKDISVSEKMQCLLDLPFPLMECSFGSWAHHRVPCRPSTIKRRTPTLLRKRVLPALLPRNRCECHLEGRHPIGAWRRARPRASLPKRGFQEQLLLVAHVTAAIRLLDANPNTGTRRQQKAKRRVRPCVSAK